MNIKKEAKSLVLVVILIILLLIVVNSCKSDDGWNKLTIHEGNHYYTGQRVLDVENNNTEMNYRVLFDSSCVYDKLVDGCEGDWNKLFGFTLSSVNPHVNSMRFVWKTMDGQLKLGDYSYIDGVISKNHFIIDIYPNVQYNLQIWAKNGRFYYIVNGEVLWNEKHNVRDYKYSNVLYPYFGGDCKAPKDINISFKKF